MRGDLTILEQKHTYKDISKIGQVQKINANRSAHGVGGVGSMIILANRLENKEFSPWLSRHDNQHHNLGL